MARSFRYTQIADSLRAAISDGSFADGVVLPSESELSEAHDASRVTIRRALEQLRSEGLVDSRQGFGWIVGSPLRQSLDSLETIEQQLASAGRIGERKVLRFGFVPAPKEVTELLGPEVLEVVRLNLADDEPFALVSVWCDAELGASMSRTLVEQSTFVDLLHPLLGQATQIIGAIAAADETAEVLQVEPGSPLLRVRRVTLTTTGETALVSEHLYPAHRTEFEVTLTNPSAMATGLRLVE